MKVKIYANYGVLAHEKETVYSTVPMDAVTRDALFVEIPDELEPAEAEDGSIIITVSGTVYLLSELLRTGKDCKPILQWSDGRSVHTVKLTEEESK